MHQSPTFEDEDPLSIVGRCQEDPPFPVVDQLVHQPTQLFCTNVKNIAINMYANSMIYNTYILKYLV